MYEYPFDAVCFVYDIGNVESFEHIKEWNDKIGKHQKKETLKVLIGNKMDLHEQHAASGRIVKDQSVSEMLSKCNMIDSFKTSAKTGENVNAVFESIITKIKRENEIAERRVTHPFYG